jgi:hypothetical protein
MTVYQKRTIGNSASAETLTTPERRHVVGSLGLVAVDYAENVEAVVENVNG